MVTSVSEKNTRIHTIITPSARPCASSGVEVDGRLVKYQVQNVQAAAQRFFPGYGKAAGEGAQILDYIQVFIQIVNPGGNTQNGLDTAGILHQLQAVHPDVSGGGRGNGGYHPDKCGLTGAVRTKQAEALALSTERSTLSTATNRLDFLVKGDDTGRFGWE
jgi:hypothetical protein